MINNSQWCSYCYFDFHSQFIQDICDGNKILNGAYYLQLFPSCHQLWVGIFFNIIGEERRRNIWKGVSCKSNIWDFEEKINEEKDH